MNVETMGPNECLQCKWDQKDVEWKKEIQSNQGNLQQPWCCSLVCIPSRSYSFIIGAEQTRVASCNVSIILLRGCSNKRLSKVTGRLPLIMPFSPHKVHMDICTHLLLYCRMYNHPEAFLCDTPSSLFSLAAGNKQWFCQPMREGG